MRKKIVLFLLSVTLLLKTATLLHASEYEKGLANQPSSSGNLAGLWYGGLSLFAMIMVVVGIRMARDREQKALRRQMAEMEVAKAKAESLREEVVLEEKRLRHARADALKELEGSLSRIQTLDALLREKEKLLRNRDWEIKSLRSQLSALTGQSAPANAQGLSVLEEQAEKQTELLQAKDAAIAELEKSLNGKLLALESNLAENEKFLKVRSEEVEALRKNLIEQAAAKNRTETFLQEEVEKAKQALQKKDAAFKDLEKSLSGTVRTLGAQLGEREKVLQGRDVELESLRSERDALTGRLADLESGKERAESLLKEELKKSTEILQSKVTAVDELEQRLSSTVDTLESRLAEREKLLQDRDAELVILRSTMDALAETGSARERAEHSLEEELRRERQALQEKDTQIKELEERSGAKVRAFETQLGEREKLLESRNEALEALKVELHAMTGRLTEMAAAKNQAESLLREELRKKTEILEATDAAVKELDKGLSRRVQALERQLGEREKLLQSRDAESESLRSERDALTEQLIELELTKEREASLLKQELQKSAEILQSKVTAVNELEQRLSSTVNAFESRLVEREKLLQDREAELATLRSTMDALAETGSARERAEHSLEEELRRERQALQEKDAAIKELQAHLSATVETLESQLSERDELLRGRNLELEADRSEINNLTDRLAKLVAEKSQAETLLQRELEKKTELLQSTDTAFKELHESLGSNVDALKLQLIQRDEFLRERDAELDALRDQLTQMGLAKDYAENLLQEELRKKTEILETTNAAFQELEKGVNAKVRALQRQLEERDELLQTRDAELEALRAGVPALIGPMNGSGTAPEPQPEHSAIIEEAEEILGRVQALESLLNEKEELLKTQDGHIEKLASELQEKRTQLARHERAAWQSIERRLAWKQRLSKFGISIKD